MKYGGSSPRAVPAPHINASILTLLMIAQSETTEDAANEVSVSTIISIVLSASAALSIAGRLALGNAAELSIGQIILIISIIINEIKIPKKSRPTDLGTVARESVDCGIRKLPE